ncbi:DJ-1/PfpI family protein [Dellaglioa sp. BT-FLS60]
MSKIMLLLPNGFEAIEAGVFTDVMGWNMMEGDHSTELVTVGLHPIVKSTWNMQVKPEYQLHEIELDTFDALVIPGGFEESHFYDDVFRDEVTKTINYFNEHNKIITTVTVCYGDLSFERANILKGKTVTSYIYPTSLGFKQLSGFRDSLPQYNVIKQTKGKVIASVNPGTAFKAAFLLLEKLTTYENAKYIKNIMGFSA